MNEWINELVNDWMNEWLNDWMNGLNCNNIGNGKDHAHILFMNLFDLFA